MGTRSLIKVIVFLCAFLTCVFLARPAAYSGAPTPDDLVLEGKGLLLNNEDIYAADAKFAEALAKDPANEKANFWRAITVISSDPVLKTGLQGLGMLDAGDEFTFYDKAGNERYFQAPVNSSTYDTNPVDSIIVDNSDTGYSEIYNPGFEWQALTADKNAYGGNCKTHAAGTGLNKAVWTFNTTVSGYYTVYAYWPYSPGNAPDAKYVIYHNGGSDTVIKDQSYQNRSWVQLGTFNFGAGTYRVELSDNISSGYQVAADAIKLKFYCTIDMDDTQAVFTDGSCGWQTVTDNNAYDGSYKAIGPGTGGTCVWTPAIAHTGKYHLSVYYIPSDDNAADAAYTIAPDGGTPVTVTINQQIKGKSKHGNKRAYIWMDLGLYELKAGTGNTITLAQNAGGKVVADNFRAIWVRDFPDMTEMQSTVSSILTELDTALGYLNNVSSAFLDTIGDGSSAIEIDKGDALMLKFAMDILKMNLNTYLAYDQNNLNIEELLFSSNYLYTSFTINDFLNKYTSLETLMPDAGVRLTTAKQALIDGINAYIVGYDFIKSETDPQDNDLITFDDKTIQMMDAVIVPKLQQVLDNLNGDLDSFTLSSADFPSSSGAPMSKITMNLRSFFDDPISLRDSLPAFDADNRPVRSSVPDPTFGGLLPDMTQAELNGLMHMGPQLSQPIACWSGDSLSINLEWKKDTYSDFASYKIYRSATDDVGENSDGTLRAGTTLAASITDQNVTTFTDSTLDGGQRIYYYRLYTCYNNKGQDKVASGIRKVMTKIYVNIANSSGNEDGSPEHPYKLLSDAFDTDLNGAKIIVAAGTYRESSYTMYICGKDNLVLEGGYEPANWARDIQANETIIDGTGLEGNLIQTAYQSNFVIDGFTIKGAGSGSYEEAAISIYQTSSATVKNCKIINNEEGMYICENSSNVLVENCYISQNTYGGIRICSNALSATIFNNIIQGNGTADPSHGNSSGIDCWGNGNTTVAVINNTVLDNKGFGGIHYDNNMAAVEIRNNIVINNNGGWGNYGIDGGSCPSRMITNNDSCGNAGGNYYNCGTDAGQNGNISVDPLFATAPNGSYYLAPASPCVDAGSGTAANLGLQGLTTRVDGTLDAGIADIGYHYGACKIKTDEIIADFGPSRGNIWLRAKSTAWSNIYGLSAVSMVTGDINGDGKDELIVNFGAGHGIWARCADGSWSNFHGLAPQSMVTGDINGDGKDELIINFGAGYGIWVRYGDGTWSNIHGLVPQSMVTGDINGDGKDELIVNFGAGYGIWVRYANGTWSNVHGLVPQSMVTGDINGDGKDEIIVNFGTRYGIWVRYADGTWSNIHGFVPQAMVTRDINGDGKDEIIIDLGTGYGIWARYSDGSWSNLHGLVSESMMTADINGDGKKELIVNFGAGYGIWARYADGSWANICDWNPASMARGKFES